MNNDDGTESYSQYSQRMYYPKDYIDIVGRRVHYQRRDGYSFTENPYVMISNDVPHCDLCRKDSIPDEEFHEAILNMITHPYGHPYGSFFPTRQDIFTRRDIKNLCRRFHVSYYDSCALCEIFLHGKKCPQQSNLTRKASQTKRKRKDDNTIGERILEILVWVYAAIRYLLLPVAAIGFILYCMLQ